MKRPSLMKSMLNPAVSAASCMLAALALANPVSAKTPDPHAERFPYASLQAEAVTEVKRESVRITLAAEVAGAEQAVVATELTSTVNEVMSKLRDNVGVKVYSGNYQVWPMNDKDGRISNWRGRAEIMLESTDFEGVSKLASAVADKMPVANMSFFVAPRERARYEAELLQEAGEAFRERAEALTKAFGFDSYAIREIQLGGAGASYAPERRMMAMSADMAGAGIPLEAGTERISLSVQGTIFLYSSKE